MQPIVFVDLDGVLVDLVGGLENQLDKKFEIETKQGRQEFTFEFHKFASNTTNWQLSQFWSKLPPTKDCEQIWKAVKAYKPLFLSSVAGYIPAIYGKELWCRNNLGIDSDRVILVSHSEDKQKYASKMSILIDDYDKNVSQFKSAGGQGILHKTAVDTIKTFNEYIKIHWKYPIK